MSDVPKKILEKNSHGDIGFTPYGEFLSYYHAHLQIFNKLIERKKLSKSDSDNLTKSIKSFMTANVKKTDHFFENVQKFAGLLGISIATLQDYLNSNFLETLNKVQEKLKAQESEKANSSSGSKKSYNSILEELTDLFGDKLLKNVKFVKEDGRLILVDLTSGNHIESKSAVQEENTTQEVKKKEPEPIQRGPEKSILKELIERFGDDLKGLKLEVQNPNQFSNQTEEQTPIIENQEPEKEILDDIEDLQFEDDSVDQDSAKGADDLDFILSQIPEKPKDPVDHFMFKEYNSLLKTIQSFQAAKDSVGYTNWMNGLSDLEKSFISIRNYITKEEKGETVNWETVFKTISSKTTLASNSLQNLKSRILLFRKTKMIVDSCIAELKSLPPQVLGIAKAAWPHIANSFDLMPDRENVESSLQNILSRIKNEEERRPISKVLLSAIAKLTNLHS